MRRTAVLVSGEWAEVQLGKPGVVFVAVDDDRSAYDSGHLPGAVWLGWSNLSDLTSAAAAGFASLLSATGIRNDDTVVLYGEVGNRVAAYAYWCFKLYGHEDVRLLAGGRKKWQADARPVDSHSVSRPPTHYLTSDDDASTTAFRDDLLGGIGTACLDSRSLEEFIADRTPRHFIG